MPPRVSNGVFFGLAATPARDSVPIAHTACREFSTTSSREVMTKHRKAFTSWLRRGYGAKLLKENSGSKYAGPMPDQPFPLNPLFRSQPVLDEPTRDLIWTKVVDRGEPIKSVSAEMGVDVRRIAAVVRLKGVEKEWKQQVSQTCSFVVGPSPLSCAVLQ